MAIDPSIALNIRPVQLDSPVNALAQALRVQGMQQEAQLGQAKLAEYERGRARQNAMQSLLQSLKPDATDDQRVSSLRGGGFFDEADRIEKGIGERRKVDSEASEREWKVKKDKLTVAGNAFGGVMRNPTLENALGTLDYLGGNGVLPLELVEQYRGVVQANPGQIGMLAEQAYRSVLDADKQLVKPETRNLGGTTQTLGIDPVTGKTTVLHTATNTVSPDALLQASTARRGQDMTDQRAREAQKGQYDAERALLIDTRTGTARPVTGAGGTPLGMKDAPQKASDARAVLSLLDQAKPLVDTATGSYAGAGADQVMQFFGATTRGSQAAAQLKALEGALVSKMPKMSGPQSDKDVAMYRQMAGQIGDPTVPSEIKIAAMRTIREIAERNLAEAQPTPTQPRAAAGLAPQNNGLPSGWTVEVH